MPRSTTHVPTSDVHRAVSSTAHKVVRMNSLSVNGATHHAHGSVRKSVTRPLAVVARRRVGDGGGVERASRSG